MKRSILIYIFDSAKFSLLAPLVEPALGGRKASLVAPAWRQFTRLSSQANDLIYNVSIFIKLCCCDNVLLKAFSLANWATQAWQDKLLAWEASLALALLAFLEEPLVVVVVVVEPI